MSRSDGFAFEGLILEGVWHDPDGEPTALLVLAHGAGGDMDDPFLVGVGEWLVTHGVATLRFNLPYRQAGRRAPGSQTQSERGYAAVLEAVRTPGIRLFCGGKSYGGRIATHLAANGEQMDGLVLCSYPLHPPGKPERLRDGHLGDVGVPMLFVQGTKDPFARPELRDATYGRLEGATVVAVDGGDHSLRVKGRSGAEVCDEIAGAISSFIC